MHLAVDAQERPVGVDDDGGVVIQPVARFSNSEAMMTTLCFAAILAQRLGDSPGIVSASLEEAMVLAPGRNTASGTAPACR